MTSVYHYGIYSACTCVNTDTHGTNHRSV